MELGISIDAQDSAIAIPLLQQWCDTLKHIQFYLNANLSAEDISSVCTTVETFGRTFSYSFHAYGYLNPAEENNFVRNAWLTTGKESIDFLADIGGKFINFHLGYALSSSCVRQNMLYHALETITNLCEYAVSKHININIENDYSSEHIRRLGDCEEDIQFFLQHRPKNLFLCFDIGHANISFSSPYFYQEILGAIQSFHIHNNDGLHDSHIAIGGAGTVDLSHIYCTLSKISNIYGILENDLTDYPAALRFIKEKLPSSTEPTEKKLTCRV